MNLYVLSLGSNLGDRIANLRQAKVRLAKELGEPTGQSSVYETAAWGNEDQDPFYNQIIEGSTTLNPQELLSVILSIEKEFGRERVLKWSPRTIDIDILFFGKEIITTEELVIPHPMFHLRKFTLVPLVELMPDLQDPRSGKTMQELLNVLKDNLEVKKINE
ncbi:MAG TPA: 2-amino-4-hydroxy-6-hydroxymethyldihydropteridine diphosphokinase [Bacteroidia bacterium]|nr:2-amino-4-hydroxy-6-hydroxymethyldihydropteridine diphosphokinase [Bacteroidia bacterium]